MSITIPPYAIMDAGTVGLLPLLPFSKDATADMIESCFYGKDLALAAGTESLEQLRARLGLSQYTILKRQTMSIEALTTLIQRASDDADFRRQLQFDPHQAFQGVDLTTAEFNALKSGSAAKLRELGLDEALSKQGARVRLSPTLRWPLT